MSAIGFLSSMTTVTSFSYKHNPAQPPSLGLSCLFPSQDAIHCILLSSILFAI